MAIALVNARVLVDDGLRTGLAVLVDGEDITAVVDANDPRVAAAQRHDLGGRLLLPGFIDCQVNGGGDVLFNDAPTVETIRRIGAAHRRYGTTGFLPTLISDTPQAMAEAIVAVDAAIAQGVPGVLGIHLEGPYLAPQRKGAHDAAKFRAPDADDVALAASLRSGVTVLTLAPEQVSDAALTELVRRGVIVAAGHTATDYARLMQAFALGVRGVTHLFNAMTPLTGREPGAVGAALDHRDSWCGLINDGHHVHAASLRTALRAKPRGRTFFVTDAMPPVGGELGEYSLAGQRVVLRDGQCVNEQGALAGSALDMITAVRNGVELLGLPLEDSARMASTWPAEFLGIAGRRGRIAAGCAADLVVVDPEWRVHETWIAGQRETH
ncbi:MAG: N-acetylglucosamine-6-phosphate deacetylase [Lysobacterales bacterium 69-70]|nr:N-acetylglucosamine-6-phosphate deacetylase [Xanthomonadaceae bacterium]ODU30842.1 MAG: N-acetylglucosamine-6-phosphate deacetylase [Xanthomonadaceae bacterium SCN 69-320]ODV22170.1 MAG: N-acetylglucosamine-6-phosphate deacetylase [Xanthomonadaceae bacterium SCN 69-25]OJY98431.1 MAG: N-acetylglucosamine-6-phosphate deacetylase [Xanthomonadales bacterium 69-70]